MRLLLRTLVVLAAIAGIVQSTEPDETRPAGFVGWVHMGVPMSGFRVARVAQPTMPVTYALVAVRGRQRLGLREAQGAGLVRIETTEHALAWARLATVDHHPLGTASEWEIALATGPPDWYAQARPGHKGGRTYTTFGELTPRDMRAGGFSPARVARRAGGFVVARWLYLPPLVGSEGGVPTVERIVEDVAADGTLSRVVTVSRRAPSLPEGTWGVAFARR